MTPSRPPFIITQLAHIVGSALTDKDLLTLSAEDARLLATNLDYWATQCFNHANRQPQPEN